MIMLDLPFNNEMRLENDQVRNYSNVFFSVFAFYYFPCIVWFSRLKLLWRYFLTVPNQHTKSTIFVSKCQTFKQW
jgi:hypothetical protein